MDMACFNYSTTFVQPRMQEIECYRHLFQSFISLGWLPKQLKKDHLDDYVEFKVDFRHVYLDKKVAGPVIDDMVTFLAYCPGLSRKENTPRISVVLLLLESLLSSITFCANRCSDAWYG